MSQANFTSLVISGGAVKVIATLGCLKFFEEKQLLRNIKNFVGTSAGAVICFFIILGYSSVEILDFMKDIFNDDSLSRVLHVDDIFAMTSTLGISDGKALIKLFQKILYQKTKHLDITFLDLAKKFGKNLVVSVSNITHEQEEFLNVDTTPDMSVIDALRMTCSIPLLFTPVKWNGCMYVDGALYNNFPMSYFIKQGHVFADIIGINIQSVNYQNITDIMSYISFLLNTTMHHMNDLQIKTMHLHEKQNNIITIKMKDTPWISQGKLCIALKEAELHEVMQQGYLQAKEVCGMTD